MDIFWKGTAGVLISVILILSIKKQEQDLALLLSLFVCTIAAVSCLSLLNPVIDFIVQLESQCKLPSGIMRTLLKITGIGIVTDVVTLICHDSGNSAMARGLQLLSIAVILNLSLPIYKEMLQLIQRILGGL